MKKFLYIFIGVILLIVVLLFIAWGSRTKIAAHYISKGLNGVPVSIGSLEYRNEMLTIGNLIVGNPLGSLTKTAFSSKTLEIDASLSELRADDLVIEAIEISDIHIGLEYYDAGKNRTNWGKILENKGEEKKSSDRSYLIKKLTLNNLTITVTDYQGQRTQYPTLKQMVFYNISDETGFPIEEIEKAIFDIMMRRVLQEYGIKAIQQAIEQFAPQLPGIPGLFGG